MKHIHCPSNAWDCPYYQTITLEDGTEHAGCCSLYPNEDPLEECDDFAYFWEEDDDYIDDNESEEE